MPKKRTTPFSPSTTRRARFVQTRGDVQRARRAVGDFLVRQLHPELTAQARKFAAELQRPLTEKELIAQELTRDWRARFRESPQVR